MTHTTNDPDGNNADTEHVAARLESERPLPGPAFRGELRRHLVAQYQPKPSRPRLVVAAYASGGLLLLTIAATGLIGAGPFAA